MGTIGTYKITNKQNGKYYVGSSVEVEKRFWRHKNELNRGFHHCIHLQRAWDKYGEDSFQFEILDVCRTEEEARQLEQFYLNRDYGILYNTSRASTGGDLITHHPNREEIVAKITESVHKRYKSMSAEERKEKYGKSGVLNGMYNKHHTEEVRRKLSGINKGNQHAKGYKWTEEQRAKLSEVASKRIGNKNPFYGKKHSEETKKKISEANKGKLPSNTKKVSIDGVTYLSASKAARSLGISTATVLNRIRSEKFPTYTFES